MRLRGIPWAANDRTKTIGASEIAAICGFSSRRGKNRFTVWCEKTGRGPQLPPDPLAQWGKTVEASILNWYAEQSGQFIEQTPGTFLVRGEPLSATPDAIVYGSRRGRTPLKGTEAKNVLGARAKLWGAPGTADVPPDVAAQCQMGMLATGLNEWDVVACIAGGDPDVWHLVRDVDAIERMVDTANRFWRDHVLTDIPPDPGDADPALVNALYPTLVPDLVEITDADQLRIVDGFRRAVVNRMNAEQIEAEAGNIVRMLIAGHDGISGPFGKITNRQQKGRRSTDWWTVIKEIVAEWEEVEATDAHGVREPALRVNDIVEAHTTRGQAFRVLRHPFTFHDGADAPPEA